MNIATPVRSRHSPCVGICKLDEDTGLCLGCARSGEEIAAWSGLDETARDTIWQKLPERVAQMSLRVHLLPWTGREILEWTARGMIDHLGTWVTGMPGAIAEFPCTPGRDVSVHIGPDELIAQADDARFRLRASDRLRAFAFGKGGPIVIGFSRARIDNEPLGSFTPLGRDQNAIDVRDSSEFLYDFGMGRRYSRFCIRTSNLDFANTLNQLAGLPWHEVFKQAGARILAESPTRVVESQLCRIEVYSHIPPPGGTSPEGSHTHFLPQFLASGEEIPAALALPDYAAPVAIFYPGLPPA